jgi:hypothetical protein
MVGQTLVFCSIVLCLTVKTGLAERPDFSITDIVAHINLVSEKFEISLKEFEPKIPDMIHSEYTVEQGFE